MTPAAAAAKTWGYSEEAKHDWEHDFEHRGSAVVVCLVRDRIVWRRTLMSPGDRSESYEV